MSDRVVVLDLVGAEQLMSVPAVAQDDELREHLAQAIRYAEEGDICNDVFLFDYTSSYIVYLVENSIDYVTNGG